uniref:PH domain-containing protein n=1 Tax=Romanomermis culicivorax TaxID=13658 RepID=A0A915KM37_ROMCU
FARAKAKDSYEVIVPKGPFSTRSPKDYEGTLSLRSAFTYRRKHCRLRKGSLSIFSDRNKTRIRHLIHLGITSSIACSKTRNRIVINTDEEIYRFQTKDSASLNKWIDNLIEHKAFALAISLKAEEVAERKSRKVTAKALAEKQAETTTTETSSVAPNKDLSVVVHSEEAGSKDIASFADQLNTVRKEGFLIISNLQENVINSSGNLILNRILQTSPIVFPISATPPTSSPMIKSISEERAPKKVVVVPKSKVSSERDEKTTSSESSEREKFLSKVSLVPAKSAKLDPLISVNAPTEGIKRRSSLPQPMGAGNVSLWSFFGQMLGKDMGKISLPVEIMEPLSVLQVVCEELEYSSLLDKAASETDPYKRMGYIGAFTVSRHSSTAFRALRKPFNSLEGETYEYVRHDLGWWYFGEQVSHNPGISATLAKGRGWELRQNAMFDSRFWGKTIVLTPNTSVDLLLTLQKETYYWRKVKTMIGNIFNEKKTVDHIGDLTIWSSNRTSCKIHFKQGCRDVTGNIFDNRNRPVHRISGNWEKSLAMWTGKHKFTLWEVGSLPPNHEKYYGFTYFALSLNEITQDINENLPPTDSRFRTDKRFLEHGKLNEARQEKHRLEEAQRARRKLRIYQPKWFDKEAPAKGEHVGNYKFTGRYWDARRKKFVNETFDQLW